LPVIINLRGTSGSGKTTAVRGFFQFAHSAMTKSFTSPKGLVTHRVMGYAITPPLLKFPLYLVGSYANTCGGLDVMGTQAEHAELVTKAYRAGGNVLCEGLLASSVSAGATLPKAMLEEAGRDKVIFAVLDTPIEVCLARVRARRAARGEEKPLNETNTRQKHEDTIKARARLIEEGYRVVDIDHTDAHHQLYRLFQENE
jgi:thymidylate kinase